MSRIYSMREIRFKRHLVKYRSYTTEQLSRAESHHSCFTLQVATSQLSCLPAFFSFSLLSIFEKCGLNSRYYSSTGQFDTKNGQEKVKRRLRIRQQIAHTGMRSTAMCFHMNLKGDFNINALDLNIIIQEFVCNKLVKLETFTFTFSPLLGLKQCLIPPKLSFFKVACRVWQQS